ncbi:hypothetical protein [Streptomyces heilongjiangensis]|uniref:Uncharacterized protein n=1 Tax=Streptomyces heilongjiangensis TaxID=945052 RepID=A0ABW1BAB2_9ACTN|nr:hypothetical protein [Streptomyces heilongjiangensis]MDC2946213.1 hypothetical protein [Streptomyces heilongjiangensis]
MDTRTTVRAGTAAACALLALGALQGSSAGARTAADGSAPATECRGTRPEGGLAGLGSPEDTPLQRTLNHVDKLVQDRYADVFTGLEVDEEGSGVSIHRMPSAAFDAAVCEAAEKGVTVRLHDTDVSEADLSALADRISEDMTRWDGTFQLREVGQDGRGHALVGVDDPDTARPIIREAYGARNARYIRVEYAPQAELL